MDKRSRRNWNRYIWVGLFLLGLGAIAWFVSQRARNATADQTAEQGEIVAAFMGDLSSSASASGKVQPQREAQLSLSAAGIVKTVFVEVGEMVEVDAPLLQLETDNLDRAIANAQQNVAIQEANLAELLAETMEYDIVSAEASVASAQANLDDLLAGPSPEQIAAQQANLRAAQASISANNAQLNQANAPANQQDIVTAEANLRSANAAVNAAWQSLQELQKGSSEADLATARANLLTAQQQKNSAQDFYDDVFTCYEQDDGYNYCPKESLQDQAAEQLQIANTNLQASQARLNDLQNGASPDAIAQAESNLASANAQRDSAQASLDKLKEGADVDSVAAAQANVSSAVANRDAAQANLDLLLAGNSDAQIEAARAQLAQAEASLAALVAGASDERIAISAAQLEQARINLEEAQTNLDNATLRAPFAGIITAIHVSEGEFASGLVVEIADAQQFIVVLDVDEIDLRNLKLGERANVTLDVFPDDQLAGNVSFIAPVPQTNNSEIVSYEVRLTLDDTDLPVRIGMTANANLETARREDVLLIANNAIQADRQRGTFSVNLVTDDNPETFAFEETEITIGLRDSQFTEVTSGLNAGDQILIGDTAPRVTFDGPFGGSADE